MWQDYAVSIILWTFIFGTIPLVLHTLSGKTYSPQTTNIPTALGNYALGCIWLTFPEPLYVSFVTNIIVGVLWTLIAIGSYKYQKRIRG
jgi:glucose uptake protein GlcU